MKITNAILLDIIEIVEDGVPILQALRHYGYCLDDTDDKQKRLLEEAQVLSKIRKDVELNDDDTGFELWY